jgi:hypothetical protein
MIIPNIIFIFLIYVAILNGIRNVIQLNSNRQLTIRLKIIGCIIVPPFEEIIFRDFLLNLLGRNISCLSFALMHISNLLLLDYTDTRTRKMALVQVLLTYILANYLVYLDNLIYSIFIHIVFNFAILTCAEYYHKNNIYIKYIYNNRISEYIMVILYDNIIINWIEYLLKSFIDKFETQRVQDIEVVPIWWIPTRRKSYDDLCKLNISNKLEICRTTKKIDKDLMESFKRFDEIKYANHLIKKNY